MDFRSLTRDQLTDIAAIRRASNYRAINQVAEMARTYLIRGHRDHMGPLMAAANEASAAMSAAGQMDSLDFNIVQAAVEEYMLAELASEDLALDQKKLLQRAVVQGAKADGIWVAPTPPRAEVQLTDGTWAPVEPAPPPDWDPQAPEEPQDGPGEPEGGIDPPAPSKTKGRLSFK